MKPLIKFINPKKLLGKSLQMTLANNTTQILWKSFMQDRTLINNEVTNDLFSIQVYHQSLNFKNFNPSTQFTKWAVIEVSDYDAIPNRMKPYEFKGGLYAVFDLVGSIPEFIQLSQFIFNEWLPNSDYKLDQREHFELLGDKYKRNDSTSEEEVWIPIKVK